MSLSLSQAAARLGVSVKALRLYEQAGLLTPGRTAAGWRAYGPAETARAAEIAALRALGLSLAQVGRVLAGDEAAWTAALDAHEAALKSEAARIAGSLAKLRALRLAPGALSGLLETGPSLAFDLPWPWGGEPFSLPAIAPITWITGPLGSGKTRLAQRIAEVLPDTRFLPLDRPPGPSARMEWLLGEGATPSDALSAVLAALDSPGENLVIDLVEQGWMP
ncbi:MerR family transcriptional regulator [Rhodovarius crocodyli]|uniref:MerR family transcriptional regulator n=1 Tax=Rhodovarius crocodyli TaxID=1979269 RepID=UPI00197E3651|nr:MerR family transcriptional regulator [Rhodovarius crocodyli]